MSALLHRIAELAGPQVAQAIQTEFGGVATYVPRPQANRPGVAVHLVGSFRHDMALGPVTRGLPAGLQALDACGLHLNELRVGTVGIGIGYLDHLQAMPELQGITVLALPR